MRRARRDFVASLPPAGYAAALDAFGHHLAPLLRREGPLAGYVAHRGEVDIMPFLLRAFHAGHRIALPHVPASDGGMHFVDWHPDTGLAPGFAGIPQPEASGARLLPTILLTPLVAFDRTGRRLGQGGGFYDRWFADHPSATRIGIAWSMQEVEALASDPWDIPLHAIVTEKEWIAP